MSANPRFRSRSFVQDVPLPACALAAAVVLVLSGPTRGQTNFLSLNNGSEAQLVVPGTASSGTNPNLYYRCFSGDIFYAPQDGSPAGLEVTGFQFAVRGVPFPLPLGYPLFFFVEDPSRSCILSAAVGGGFPPNRNKIVSSPNTLAAFTGYTPAISSNPFAWWFSFQSSSAMFHAPDPASGGGDLLAGWSDRFQSSTSVYTPPILSRDETSSAKSRSFVNLNAAGMGLQRLTSMQEWEFALQVMEPTVQPEMTRNDGTWDMGGAGGYSPAVDPGRMLRFRSMDLSHAGTGVFSIPVANLTFQASPNACHVPGVTMLGQHLPVNLDFFWLLTASALAGPAYTPPSILPLVWNPNAGWTPGGESLSPPMPIGLPGLVGLQMCFGSYGFDPAGPPFLVAASQGSTLRLR